MNVVPLTGCHCHALSLEIGIHAASKRFCAWIIDSIKVYYQNSFFKRRIFSVGLRWRGLVPVGCVLRVAIHRKTCSCVRMKELSVCR